MTMESLILLGDEVSFCRIKPAADGNPAELIRGNGIVVGHIIGVQRRRQYMVKDTGLSGNKAWTLEPFCIDPSDEEAALYLAHHEKLQAVVDDFNAKAQKVIADGNEAVDALNAEMFGKPMDI